MILPTALTESPPNWDINSDGKCTILDYVLISNNIGKTGSPGWIAADIDKNGIINDQDISLLSNYYGEILQQPVQQPEEMAKIKKLCICFSTTAIKQSEYQQFIAEHFDLLVCDDSHQVYATKIHNLNPNIKLLSYFDSMFVQDYDEDYSYITQHEDWFFHDINGKRIRYSLYGGPYLMNPDSAWSNYYAQKILKYLQTYTIFDGIFSDDTTLDLQEIGIDFNVPLSQFKPGILANYPTDMYNHIKNLQTTIGTKKIMPNSWLYTQICEDITHIHCWESFVHGRNMHDITENGYNEDYILLAIDKLHEQAEKGNIISVLCGTEHPNSNPELAHKIMKFTLACFMFAVEDLSKSYYAWDFMGDDTNKGYYPEMDYEFGKPLGDYYHVEGSIYARNFQNGTVVANLSPYSDTFTIEGKSYTIEGRTGRVI
jgi:hypothetical protein